MPALTRATCGSVRVTVFSLVPMCETEPRWYWQADGARYDNGPFLTMEMAIANVQETHGPAVRIAAQRRPAIGVPKKLLDALPTNAALDKWTDIGVAVLVSHEDMARLRDGIAALRFQPAAPEPPDVARRVVAAKADIVRVVHAAVELSVREVMRGRAVGDGTLIDVRARLDWKLRAKGVVQ